MSVPAWQRLPVTSSPPLPIIILGAGLAGCATAYMLRKNNIQITLIDREAAFASKASGNPAGVTHPFISVNNSNEAFFYEQALSSLLHWLKAHPQLYTDCGVLQLAWSPRIQQQQQKYLKKRHLSPDFVHPLTPEAISAHCNISSSWPGLFFPLAGYLQPRQLCQYYLQQCPHLQTRYNCDISSIAYHSCQWHVFNQAKDTIAKAPMLILCNSHEAKQFIPWLGLQKVRGQISCLGKSQLQYSPQSVICHQGYLLPAINNQHIIGASFDPQNDSDKLSLYSEQSNLDTLQKILPNILNNTTIFPQRPQGRVAFRCMTPDHLPLIGPVPDIQPWLKNFAELKHGKIHQDYKPPPYLPGLYINTGHGSRGIQSIFLAAKLLAQHLQGNNKPLQDMPFLFPSRQLLKRLKQGVYL